MPLNPVFIQDNVFQRKTDQILSVCALRDSQEKDVKKILMNVFLILVLMADNVLISITTFGARVRVDGLARDARMMWMSVTFITRAFTRNNVSILRAISRASVLKVSLKVTVEGHTE